jgi:regulatory protein
MELKKKQVSDEIIDELILNQSENLELETAREAADKWQRKNSNCPKEKIYSRLGGFLSRQGFSYDIVKEILAENHK